MLQRLSRCFRFQKNVVSVEHEVRALAVEHARTHTVSKPWGIVDPRPWSKARGDGKAIGETWYQRPGSKAVDTALLLKVLFTSQPLSIQVHPDDAFARSIGLPNGKTEAWHVLSATPDAQVALGLKDRLTSQQLRQAGEDGTIAELVAWHAVARGDTILVPAGTIHAIGGGLVIAEIQQRSDATFRLYDHGRHRELHIEDAIAVADAGPAKFRVTPTRLSDARTLLVSNPHFIFERIELAPHTQWCLAAEQETWLLVVEGGARVGSFDVAKGDAVFARSDRVDVHAGGTGIVGLMAYTGDGISPDLLQPRGSKAVATDGCMEAIQ
jgi:mannose-6-phosphate isomerase